MALGGSTEDSSQSMFLREHSRPARNSDGRCQEKLRFFENKISKTKCVTLPEDRDYKTINHSHETRNPIESSTEKKNHSNMFIRQQFIHKFQTSKGKKTVKYLGDDKQIVVQVLPTSVNTSYWGNPVSNHTQKQRI